MSEPHRAEVREAARRQRTVQAARARLRGVREEEPRREARGPRGSGAQTMTSKEILAWILALWITVAVGYWLVWWPLVWLGRRRRERESTREFEREVPEAAAILKRISRRIDYGVPLPHLSGAAAVAFACQLALALLFFVLWLLWGFWLTWSAGLGFLAVLIGMIGIEATKRGARCPRCGNVPPSLAGS